MTHKERLMAAVKGEWLDRPCLAFWGPHYNLEEANAKDLAFACIANQQAYQYDFIKVMASGMYIPEAFGQVIPYATHSKMEAWLNVQKFCISHANDWLDIRPVKVSESEVLQRNVEAVKIMSDHFQGDVPILPTVFSPASAMGECCGGFFDEEKFVSMCMYEPQKVEHGLEAMEETLINLMEAFIDAGASGFFFGMQNGLNRKLGHDLFMHFEHDPSARVLNAINSKTWFNMLHLCNGLGDKGDTEAVEWCLDLPADAINYPSTWSWMPSFKELRAKTDKVLVGGIENNAGVLTRKLLNTPGHNDFSGNDRNTIYNRLYNRVKDAIDGAGNKLVIAGGCGIYEPHRFGVMNEVMDAIEAERAAGRK